MNYRRIVSVGFVSVLALTACSGSNESGETDQQIDEIMGVDPGAGVMMNTEEAIKEYGLDINLQPSSDPAMTAALGDAYDNEEPIIVTASYPHWIFLAYDLKYLDDPKGVYGETENIHTFARNGLEEDAPEAFAVLDQFYWEPEDIGAVMLDVFEGMDPTEAASSWVEEHQDKVSEWTEGVDEVSGGDISLSYVAWDSETASTHVIGQVLENIGYTVELTQLEPAFMWASVDTGDADAMVGAWLPKTHGSYYEDYKDNIVDLGTNLEGARIGLAVPEYVDIDSIEDLK
ncbi:glycine betaine ABC transporter substrate-binding protein [Alkalicoccobacillus murimartini]|uniref:Glycine betaine/proline transport system substrate-binding protein n=1 Tax=Alkalicoccobacillus murimartini TaxID=171685 RepID=A0ABT9YLL8_9BACI|nr:glycine betaine ABC transporter substrate-binding protein [Alkalicoccobacillus murimartini]MDQ0208757.1 glycine betaine/proline transport system substrate-binding protein [Alkalicoccobacillus murimartini]